MLLQQVIITDEDIRQQETKVEGARKKLEELLAAIEKSGREKLLLEDKVESALVATFSRACRYSKADNCFYSVILHHRIQKSFS